MEGTLATMRALKSFIYGQRKRRVGDLFEVSSPLHATALRHAALAVEASEIHDEEHPVLLTEKPRSTETITPAPAPKRGRPKGSKNRTYKRRDLVAE
jgi:hypothetical protein